MLKLDKLAKWAPGMLLALLAAKGLVAADAPAAAPFTTADAESLAALRVAADTVWVLLAGALVFFMNTGFGLVESGFCRSKNTVNILSKNFIVFSVSSLAFYLVGFGLMFGNGTPFAGSEGVWMLGGADNSPATGDAYAGAYGSISWTGVPLWAKFFFQLAFAGTAATIVSGAVAERIKYLPFIVFSFILVAFMYPLTGHWVWGGGWLASAGFWDFAGSSVVHSVGGWAALAGVIVLGPRLGKYRDGKVQPLAGHNLSSAFMGAMILWLGWFGFNPGSTMAALPADISLIFVTTNMAAIMGVLFATGASWALDGKPDLGMSINGALAGLVAITAPCAFVSVPSALIIGAGAGILVVAAVKLMDFFQLDDPVGAIPVHLVNGIYGTLALGLFADTELTGKGLFMGGGTTLLFAQIKGILAIGAFTFIGSLVVWFAIKAVLGMRVSEKEEVEGLDLGEHGQNAYGGFKMSAE
jgi:ammonium transporter, Amt family